MSHVIVYMLIKTFTALGAGAFGPAWKLQGSLKREIDDEPWRKIFPTSFGVKCTRGSPWEETLPQRFRSGPNTTPSFLQHMTVFFNPPGTQNT